MEERLCTPGLRSVDLDEPPQWPRSARRQGAAQPLHVDHLTGGEPDPLSPTRSLLLPGLSRVEIGADGVHVVEILWQQIHFAYGDPESFFYKDHQPEEVQRINDAALQQWSPVGQRQQRPVLDEFSANEVIDHCLHSGMSLSCLLALFYQPSPAGSSLSCSWARPTRSTLPFEVRGSASRNSTRSGTM
jgi:hypothetical protein